MAISSRLSFALIGAVALSVIGEVRNGTAAPIRPEKDKENAYAKKLVGTWVYKDDGAKGGASIDFTIEFKADGDLKMSVAQGQFEVSGTWKAVKEEGKTVTIEAEMTLQGVGGGAGARQQKTLSVVFEDADTIVITAVGDKPDPRTLKRKP
jgi:hypothetical protein